MTNRKHDLYYWLSILALIAALIAWAWYCGKHAGKQINDADANALYHRAHALAMERGE
jgi:hypothetical protein